MWIMYFLSFWKDDFPSTKINQHFLIGQPVKDLGHINWTCTICTHWSSCGSVIYRSYMSEKNMQTKPYVYMTLWPVTKWRDMSSVMETLLLLPVDEILFIGSNISLISFFSQKEHNCVYLLFLSGNSENTEQLSMAESAVNVFPRKWLQQHWDQNRTCFCM